MEVPCGGFTVGKNDTIKERKNYNLCVLGLLSQGNKNRKSNRYLNKEGTGWGKTELIKQVIPIRIIAGMKGCREVKDESREVLQIQADFMHKSRPSSGRFHYVWVNYEFLVFSFEIVGYDYDNDTLFVSILSQICPNTHVNRS